MIASVIVLHYKDPFKTKMCIKSIIEGTKSIDYELIVINNGSKDKELEKIKKLFKGINNIKFINLSQNYGYAGGNNIGAHIAKGKYLIFLNNDIVVTKNWLTPLIELMEKYDDIGAVQSVILDYRGRIENMGFFIDVFGNLVPMGYGKSIDYVHTHCVTEYIEILAFSGAAFATRKDLFIKVGGFDSKYFLYFEDIDLSWRIRNNGYRILCSCNSFVYHYHMSTSKYRKALFRYFEKRNKVITYLKNSKLRYIPYLFLGLLGGLLLDIIRWNKLKENAFGQNLIGIIAGLKYLKNALTFNRAQYKKAEIIKSNSYNMIKLFNMKRKFNSMGSKLYYEKYVLCFDFNNCP